MSAAAFAAMNAADAARRTRPPAPAAPRPGRARRAAAFQLLEETMLRPRFLEDDADAATRGISDGLFGLVADLVVLETASKGQAGNGERVGVSTGR